MFKSMPGGLISTAPLTPVLYEDVLTYSCDGTHTMDTASTNQDITCGANGVIETLASKNIKCNAGTFYKVLYFQLHILV